MSTLKHLDSLNVITDLDQVTNGKLRTNSRFATRCRSGITGRIHLREDRWVESPSVKVEREKWLDARYLFFKDWEVTLL